MPLDTEEQCPKALLKLPLEFLVLPAFESLSPLGMAAGSPAEEAWRRLRRAEGKKCRDISKTWVIGETKARKRDTEHNLKRPHQTVTRVQKPLSSNTSPLPQLTEKALSCTALQPSFDKEGVPCVRPVQIVTDAESRTTEHLPRMPVIWMPSLTQPLSDKCKPVSGEGTESTLKGRAPSFKADPGTLSFPFQQTSRWYVGMSSYSQAWPMQYLFTFHN